MKEKPIEPKHANSLGAHAAESQNQIRFALAALERGDIASARERLRSAHEYIDIVRNECYWDTKDETDTHCRHGYEWGKCCSRSGAWHR